MEERLEINRLDKDELIYELMFRGLSEKKTVYEMRTTLRHLLKLEKAGSLDYPTYPFTFVQDQAYLERKSTDLKTLIGEFSDVENSGAFLKIKSKLIHCFRRAERAVPTGDDEKKIRSQLLLGFISLDSELRSKARKFKRACQTATSPLEISEMLIFYKP